MSTSTNPHFEELRELVADVLEIEPEELTDTGSFTDEYGVESLRAIELLARAEKKFRIEIDQAELPSMVDLRSTYEVIAKIAGWHD